MKGEMTGYKQVSDLLCPEGKRLLDACLSFAFTEKGKLADEAYTNHRWNCPTCFRTYAPVAEYMSAPYQKQVAARAKELEERELA